MSNIITIDFHGDQLLGCEDERGAFVALKPIVEGMGLDWSAQYRRVTRDPILNEGVAIMAMPLAQEQVFLKLDLIHGWLFTVDSARVKNEVRDRVLAYQRDCYRVLADAFLPRAPRPAPIVNMPVTDEPLALRRQLVTEARHTFDRQAARELWFSLAMPVTPAMRAPLQGELFAFTREG